MMKLPKRWGLRSEIVVSLALLVAAAVGLVGLVVLKYAQREMVALKIETGLVLVKAVEERLNHPHEPKSLKRLVRILAGTGFERIVIMDRSSNVLAHSGPWPWPEHPTRSDLELVMSTRLTRTFMDKPGLFSFGPDPPLALAAPVFNGVRVTGAVGLYSPLTELRAAWTKTKWVILFYLAMDTLVTILFGTYLLSQRLVVPLTRMIGRVQAFAEGRYRPGRDPVKSENEIGRLEEAFEVMAGRLLENRVELEENLASLKQAQESLVRSEKLATVGRLAAGLAHELGNPLGSVIGFVHLLGRADLTEAERDDFLGRMKAELSRMDTIIRSLLDFARPVPASPGPVDLGRVVADALALAQVQKWFQGLDVVSEPAPDLPPGRGEVNRLTQVLVNLLANAGQAMGGQGRLNISTGRKEGEVFIIVADTGPGISDEDLPHIFEPFFTKKEPGQGTGLGLSVSLSIVESFGGRIEVKSALGQGSVFTVFLPIQARTEEA